MTPKEFKSLEPGDVVRHMSGGKSFQVTDNFGDRVIAVRTVDLTNPIEWRVVVKRSVVEINTDPPLTRKEAHDLNKGDVILIAGSLVTLTKVVKADGEIEVRWYIVHKDGTRFELAHTYQDSDTVVCIDEEERLNKK